MLPVYEIVFAEVIDHWSRVKMIHHRPTVYIYRPVMLSSSNTHEITIDRRASRVDSLPSPTQFLPRSGPRSMGKVAHCATSSFVHHFVPIGEFKLELQSGDAQFGSKSMIFEPCDLEILWMTLKNNRAPVLCYFKLCAAFRTHWWIQTGVKVRKRPIWVKFDDF